MLNTVPAGSGKNTPLQQKTVHPCPTVDRGHSTGDTVQYQTVAVAELEVSGMTIPVVQAKLGWGDFQGAARVRLGIDRMNYKIKPGLYAVGKPESHSPVLVTANYKLSFDLVRKELESQAVWILVLDTKGINVWCAAGKGTFGTDELIFRIKDSGLERITTLRKVIVPQLGAPGVAAHVVEQNTGFKVVFGPVKARHLPAFLQHKSLPADFRRIHFPVGDRLLLSLLEFKSGLKYFLPVLAFFFLFSGIQNSRFDVSNWSHFGLTSALLLFIGFVAGTVITPALLPFLPGRVFAFKGLFVNLLLFSFCLSSGFLDQFHIIDIIALACSGTAMASFFAMNFTGSSTFTSLSGVKKEMKIAVPVQIALSGFGLVLWLIGRWV